MSASMPWARVTVVPEACAATYSSSTDFPIPASPLTTQTPEAPDRRPASRSSSTARSGPRPTRLGSGVALTWAPRDGSGQTLPGLVTSGAPARSSRTRTRLRRGGPMHREHQLATSVLVIGTGGAGLRAAIELAEAGVAVLAVGKRAPDDPHTVLAAGGISAALATTDAADTWEQHAADTLQESALL